MILDLPTTLAIVGIALTIPPLVLPILCYCGILKAPARLRPEYARMTELKESLKRTQEQYSYRLAQISPENRARWASITKNIMDLDNGSDKVTFTHLKWWDAEVRQRFEQWAKVTGDLHAFNADVLLPLNNAHVGVASLPMSLGYSSDAISREVASDSHAGSAEAPAAGNPADVSGTHRIYTPDAYLPYVPEPAAPPPVLRNAERTASRTRGALYDNYLRAPFNAPHQSTIRMPSVVSASTYPDYPASIRVPEQAARSNFARLGPSDAPPLDPDLMDPRHMPGCLGVYRDRETCASTKEAPPLGFFWRMYADASVCLERLAETLW